ncbi:hypothetical protein D5F01_LYC00198 [Larimichthys crocea]|uniref:PiggyBac transposable element-derived protein domain-containing protein n=1 Tax=Larimichthys crocea TaxID=215358 RepID=A0A6G0J8Z6_LARCR|nr:hypothetical protein D5F01_LYC00198 [Larimichthys crocea]
MEVKQTPTTVSSSSTAVNSVLSALQATTSAAVQVPTSTAMVTQAPILQLITSTANAASTLATGITTQSPTGTLLLKTAPGSSMMATGQPLLIQLPLSMANGQPGTLVNIPSLLFVRSQHAEQIQNHYYRHFYTQACSRHHHGTSLGCRHRPSAPGLRRPDVDADLSCPCCLPGRCRGDNYPQRRGIRDHGQDASSVRLCSRSHVFRLFTCNVWAGGDRFHRSRAATGDVADIKDRQTRRTRLRDNKFALMRNVWDRFVQNSIACYNPGANITVDEQLFTTKASCSFSQFMAKKPGNFGIKFWLAVDVDTKYMLNGAPYLGKDETRWPGQRLGDSVVLKNGQAIPGEGKERHHRQFFYFP